MKKIILAPAVAVVAGSVAFAGPAAIAAPEATNPSGSASAADEPETPQPELSAPNDGKDSKQFRSEGQTIEYKNLEPGKQYTWSFTSDEDVQSSGKFTAKEANGSFDAIVTNDTDEMFLPGKYTVTVKDEDGETVGTTTFSVVGDDEDPGDDGDNPDAPKPELSVKHDKVRATPFRDNGHAVEYKNLEPGKKYTWSIHGGEEISSTGTFTAEEANGTFYVEVPSDTDVSFLPGEYTVKLEDENGTTLDSVTTFTVVKDSEDSGNPDEHEVRYQLKLDRNELTAKEFLNKETGVQMGVIGLKSNEKFTYSVTKVDGDGEVEDYENEATADEHGRWGTTLHGVQRGQSVESFVGKYKVTVKSEQGELTDHFTVTSGKKNDNDDDAEAGDNDSGNGSDNGSGSGDDSNAGNSSNLPRTGAGLTGLIAGGALLTVGAATVLITRRRAK